MLSEVPSSVTRTTSTDPPARQQAHDLHKLGTPSPAQARSYPTCLSRSIHDLPADLSFARQESLPVGFPPPQAINLPRSTDLHQHHGHPGRKSRTPAHWMLRPYLLLQQKRVSIPARTNMRTCWRARGPPEREDGSVSRKCFSEVFLTCFIPSPARRSSKANRTLPRRQVESCGWQAWPELFLGKRRAQPPASPSLEKAKPGGSRTQDIASKSIYHGVEPALWQVVSC